MSQTVTVIQIDLEHGTQWGDENIVNFIREICIPSVQSYCRKNNYKHLLINKSEYLNYFDNFNFFDRKLKHFAFERYFHLNKTLTDATIYLDNDIYIFQNADPVEFISGLMCAQEPESETSRIFREVNNLPNVTSYYNSGVIMCDRDTSFILSRYMLNRIKNNKKSKGKNTDNMMLNDFILENNEHFSSLDRKWNYMPFLPNGKKRDKPAFYHFVGIQGKKIIEMILKNKFDLEDFLVNAKFNYN